MSHPEKLSPADKTVLVYGVFGALCALALHIALTQRAWPWGHPHALAFAMQWVWLVPLAGAMLAGMREGRRWLVALAAYGIVLPALNAYGLAALQGPQAQRADSSLLPLATLMTGISGFLLLPLIQALDITRPQWDYPRVFRAAWRNAVHLALAAMLTLAVHLLIWATGAMFRMIGLGVVETVLRSTRTVLLIMPVVFAISLIGVRRRPQLADTLQRSWLTLNAWLLPLVALVGITFLVALAARLALDLQAVTLSATGLIAFSLVWIKLINAAWQDNPAAAPFGPRLQRVLRAAQCGLLPLAAVALYGLAVRIGEYGWTTPRVWGIYLGALLFVYALGYACAALRPRHFHTLLGATNIIAAVGALLVLAVVNTPLLSPQRLTADSQVQRLIDGRTDPQKFHYLGFIRDNGHYGWMAMQRLAAGAAQAQSPQIALAAAAALEDQYYRWDEAAETVANRSAPLPQPALRMSPSDRKAPEGLWEYLTTTAPYQAERCVRADEAARKDASQNARRCWLIYAPISAADADDVVLYVPNGPRSAARNLDTLTAYTRQADGQWTSSAYFRRDRTVSPGDEDLAAALAQGRVRIEPRREVDLIIGEERMRAR